jgi:hypothetical protein
VAAWPPTSNLAAQARLAAARERKTARDACQDQLAAPELKKPALGRTARLVSLHTVMGTQPTGAPKPAWSTASPRGIDATPRGAVADIPRESEKGARPKTQLCWRACAPAGGRPGASGRARRQGFCPHKARKAL